MANHDDGSDGTPPSSAIESEGTPPLLNEGEIKPSSSPTSESKLPGINVAYNWSTHVTKDKRPDPAPEAPPIAFGQWRKAMLECCQILAALATVGALIVAGFQYKMYIRPRLIAEEALDEAIKAERVAKHNAEMADERRRIAEVEAQAAELQRREALQQRDSAAQAAAEAASQVESKNTEVLTAAVALKKSREDLAKSASALKAARTTSSRLKCESKHLSAEIEISRREVARWHSHSFLVWMKDQCTATLARRRFTDEEHVSCMVALYNGVGPAREWAATTDAIGTGDYIDRLGLRRQVALEALMKKRIVETGGGEMLSHAVNELPKQLNLTASGTDGLARSQSVDRAIDAAVDAAFGSPRNPSTVSSRLVESGC